MAFYKKTIFSYIFITAFWTISTNAFAPIINNCRLEHGTSTSLNGLFDNWRAGGTGRDNLDEEVSKYKRIYLFLFIGDETENFKSIIVHTLKTTLKFLVHMCHKTIPSTIMDSGRNNRKF